MITITAAAAGQIRTSAEQGNMQGLPMRIAAKRNPDGTMHYGMGFDDSKEDDVTVNAGDIEIVMASSSADLLKGTTIDYVELEPEKFQFIFMNPNDPGYEPPTE